MKDRLRYGYRIIGSTAGRRRLVDAAAALAGYASCDLRAVVERQAYLSAFWFGADFRDCLAQTGSTRGFDGDCWAPFVWWDIDNEDDPQAALDHARRLASTILERYRSLDDSDLLLFFSGSKGFHVGLPVVWDAPPSLDFHRLSRRFAEGFAQLAGVKVDTTVYDKVRALPGTEQPASENGTAQAPAVPRRIDELPSTVSVGLRNLPNPSGCPRRPRCASKQPPTGKR